MSLENLGSKLPEQYQWLVQYVADGHPKMVVQALDLFGIHETAGPGDNPEIIGWARECGIVGYHHDETPWCGLFMAVVAKRAERGFPASPLWALSWANFGVKSPQPAFGDVLVFKRAGGGHVGLYIGEDAEAYHVLGGNESDQVTIVRILKSRLHAARRPSYNEIPTQVKPIRLSATGGLSSDEA